MLIRAISITMCLWRLDAALARGSLVVCAPVFAELLAAPHLALLLYLNPSFSPSPSVASRLHRRQSVNLGSALLIQTLRGAKCESQLRLRQDTLDTS